jgi:hypothetical protein
MTDRMRCPNCRGAKKVAKLGGMIGECNTCEGKGTILSSELVRPVTAVVEEVKVADIVKAVSEAIPTKINCAIPIKAETPWINDIVTASEPSVKVDPKRVLYRKKKET